MKDASGAAEKNVVGAEVVRRPCLITPPSYGLHFEKVLLDLREKETTICFRERAEVLV